jgi:hypothetical protein
MVDRRPGTVTFAAVMMVVAAVGYAVGFVFNFFLLMRPDQVQTWYGQPISDWYWVINAALDGILVIGFLWVASMAVRGDYGAGMTITLLAILNIVFSLFKLGHIYGWIVLVASIAVLVANQSGSAQAWYRRSLPPI